ncbi:MAG: hypothetical protein NC038_01525 [Paludibacter sp.]|nr:hypothetical protein [Bacteroidales bacterium]MCM1068889.1 hypothetical protein [Prevotella sp.]MCM1353150.1 hypothetical protein [Bacteroides sp.]MCM1442472.1 hypothetical protein [Muribaculum sp.]MCM1481315.1 hypothetical protein [Paludibacter sp.]
MKKLLTIVCLEIMLNSCGYYCYVSSIGSTPQNQSYYILPNNPNLIGDLEFQQYADMLATTLNRIGYQDTTEELAELIIYFDWQIGNMATESGTLPYTYNTYSSSISTNWVYTPYGSYPQMRTTTIATPQTSFISYSNDYSPIVVQVIAVDKHSRKQIWKTTINDKLEYNKTTLKSLMPIMLYAGSKYFGTTAEGRVDLFPSEVSSQGISWPY